MLQLVRIEGELPEGFDPLRIEAQAQGHANMDRLAAEWAEDPALFHALIAAFLPGGLVGVGGVTDEPSECSEPAWRMRRLYVAAAARRQGVARTLVKALLHEAQGRVRLLTVHAGNAEAESFWEAMDFSPVHGHAWSHELRCGDAIHKSG
jgi:GNAT superfamily N-acetyltransferase